MGAYRCGTCGRLGANARGCGTKHVPLTTEERTTEVEMARVVSDVDEHFSEVPAPTIAPADLGPWAGCFTGDPWCPCTLVAPHARAAMPPIV